MNIRERQDLLISFFAKAPMKKTFGMTLSYSNGSAHFSMPYQEQFDHAFGGIHGGGIATLLDNAGWFTVAQYYDTWIATANLDVQYLEPCSGIRLQAIGKLLKKGKSLAFSEMELLNEDDKIMAHGTATFAITSKTVSSSLS